MAKAPDPVREFRSGQFACYLVWVRTGFWVTGASKWGEPRAPVNGKNRAPLNFSRWFLRSDKILL